MKLTLRTDENGTVHVRASVDYKGRGLVAYEKAGIGRATAYRHLTHLRENEPEIYFNLVRK